MEKQATTLIEFGGLLDRTNIYFFVCLIAALALGFLYCRTKFDEPSFEKSDDDMTSQLLPRHLVTKQEYSKGFLTYLGSMVFTVLTLSVIGPKPLKLFGLDIPPEVGNAAIPVLVALVLVGILPNVPGLQQIEKWLRKYAHKQAFIPEAARATAEKLSAAEFDFASYSEAAVLQSPEMQGVDRKDFKRSRRSLEHSWGRLSCLIYELKSRRLTGMTQALDGELLTKYEADLDNIEDKRNSLRSAVAQYRNNPGIGDDELRRTIRKTLFRLYVLLGCAVRLKSPHEAEMQQTLRSFGFILPPAQSQPKSRDLMLVGLTVMGASVLVVSFAAFGLGQFGWWAVSEGFPRKGFYPFSILASTVLAHCLAIFVADQLRTRRLSRGDWYKQVGTVTQAAPANYVRVALACGLVGYAAFIVWNLVFWPATADLFRDAAPYALLPATTGAFFAVHLDNAELSTRPSRALEVGLQAAVTGFCGLTAATATTVRAIDAPVQELDVLILMAVIGAVIGGSFGWYFPQAAARPKLDPLTAAREERIRSLEAAALGHFADSRKAIEWIERPLTDLGDVSPKSAAKNVQGYEQAISLLEAA